MVRVQDWGAVLDAVDGPVRSYLASLPERTVGHDVHPDEVRAAVRSHLSTVGELPADVVADMAATLEPYITAHSSGRFFGFVIGGLHPAAYGAELLTATWDQNAGLYAPTPGVTIIEEIAAGWLVEQLRLPADSSVAFVTGGQMANWTCLAAARDHVLRAVGWDVEADGLIGAPQLHVVVKKSVHSTVPRALRYLGLGDRTAIEVAVDDNDGIDLDSLQATLEGLHGPTIVCVESGNVNTGAFDPFDKVAELVEAHRARGNPSWVHVDGAVGLLAAATESGRHLTAGIERMDSWSTDGHKLLNVAYDCGIAICADRKAHFAAMSVRASYLRQSDGGVREPMDWNPEFSRRARGMGVYATLRSLGVVGLDQLVARVCMLAQRFARGLARSGRAEVLNDVVFNQVLVRWIPPDGVDADVFNDAITDATAADGRTYFSGTTWRGQRLMRIAVSDWATDEADVDLAMQVLLELADEAVATLRP
jgi:glutamate/tyrosine decarboxylase-like PLP-dependent enzyme